MRQLMAIVFAAPLYYVVGIGWEWLLIVALQFMASIRREHN